MSKMRADMSTNAETDILEHEDSIKECVRYIFCREGSKVPIKRGEIIKHLNTTCQTPLKQVNPLFIQANIILQRVYGYKLVQVEGRGGVQYIVVQTEECVSLQSTVTDVEHRRLLVAALTHIFMSGAPVKEEDMWKFLTEAGLLEETNHNRRKLLISTFTKQMYLQYFKIGEGDLARNVFQWGQRAVEEIPKIFLLNKMAEAFEKSADHWCEQYKEATEDMQT